MKKDTELLDRTITYLVTFPVTIFGLLFKPSTILSTEHEDKSCPPGVAFALSLMVWFVGNRTMLRIITGKPNIPLVPTSDEVAQIIVATSAILLVQALLLSALFKKIDSKRNWRMLAQYLAYPLVAFFSVVGLVKIFSVHFPDLINQLSHIIAHIECYLDSAMRNNCSKFVEVSTTTLYNQAETVAFPVGLLFYLWTLFNVIRVYYGFSFYRGIGVTLMAVVLALVISLTGAWMVSKNQKVIKELTEKHQVSSAEQGINQPNNANSADIKNRAADKRR